AIDAEPFGCIAPVTPASARAPVAAMPAIRFLLITPLPVLASTRVRSKTSRGDPPGDLHVGLARRHRETPPPQLGGDFRGYAVGERADLDDEVALGVVGERHGRNAVGVRPDRAAADLLSHLGKAAPSTVRNRLGPHQGPLDACFTRCLRWSRNE